jgi:hypothetical protein
MEIHATNARGQSICGRGSGSKSDDLSAAPLVSAHSEPTPSREEIERASERRYQDGPALAAAWREHVTTNRPEFLRELRESIRLLRNGTRSQIAAFASRNVPARAAAAIAHRNRSLS